MSEQLTANPQELSVALSVFLLASVVVLGTGLGLQRKLVIYAGTRDTLGTCLVLVVALLTAIAFHFGPLLGWGFAAVGVILAVWSIGISCWANNSILKSILVVPTKIVLLILVPVIGLFSIGALIDGIQKLRKRQYLDGAINVAGGVVGLLLVGRYLQLIDKLTQLGEEATRRGRQKATQEKLPQVSPSAQYESRERNAAKANELAAAAAREWEHEMLVNEEMAKRRAESEVTGFSE